MLWCGNCLSAMQQLHMTSSKIRFETRIQDLCVTKSIHILHLEFWTGDITYHQHHLQAKTTYIHYDTSLDSNLMALPIPWLSSPPLCSAKSPCYWQDINPKTSAHQSIRTDPLAHTCMQLHIRQLDSSTAKEERQICAYILAVIGHTHTGEDQHLNKTCLADLHTHSRMHRTHTHTHTAPIEKKAWQGDSTHLF